MASGGWRRVGMGLFRKGRKRHQPDHFVIATLNARLQPVHRGEIYEDPLDEVLKAHDIGEVTGGGTMMTADGEVAHADLEIGMVGEITDTTASLITATLERLGAPKGSKLTIEPDGREVAFGINEGLAVYLNGTDLPTTVYAECDSNVVFAEFERLLGEGVIQSWWHGPTETALYLYGPSFALMRDAIRQFVDTYPLCDRARLVQIA